MRNLFRRRPKDASGIRQVAADDPLLARAYAAVDTTPGPAREAAVAVWRPVPADEHWVITGADGSPAGVLRLTRDAADPSLVHGWLGVDPVLRGFGLGEQLFEHLCARVRALGAARIASWADHQSGYAFLVDHGFVATTSAEDPARPRAHGPRVDGVLTL